MQFSGDLGSASTSVSTEAACDTTKVAIPVPGYPFGYESKSTKNIQKIAARLVKSLDVDIIFIDEKLTTAEANSVLKDAGMNRKKRNEIDDMLSAKIILDNFTSQL